MATKTKVDDEKKVQKSIAMPPAYWVKLDDIAWPRRVHPLTLAREFLMGAIDKVRDEDKRKGGKQAELFAKAPAEKKTASPRRKNR